MESLIASKAGINQPGWYGPPVSAALSRGHKEVAQLLIEAKADVSCLDRPEFPLSWFTKNFFIGTWAVLPLLYPPVYVLNRISGRKQETLSETLSSLNSKRSIEALASWAPEYFTDPKKHDPENFQYIVHMLSGSRSSDYFQRNLISASIINPMKTETFDNRRCGVILEVPLGHHIEADCWDIWTINVDTRGQYAQFFLNSIAGRETVSHIASPETILSTGFGHNEVSVLGTNPLTGTKVRISGIVYMTEDGKPNCRGDALGYLKKLSRDLNVPIVKIPTRAGSTHLAAQKGHTDVVKLLLEHKAYTDDENNDEETPLHLAVKNGHTQVIKLLETYSK